MQSELAGEPIVASTGLPDAWMLRIADNIENCGPGMRGDFVAPPQGDDSGVVRESGWRWVNTSLHIARAFSKSDSGGKGPFQKLSLGKGGGFRPSASEVR